MWAGRDAALTDGSEVREGQLVMALKQCWHQPHGTALANHCMLANCLMFVA